MPTRLRATVLASWCRSRTNSCRYVRSHRIGSQPGHYAVGHMFMPRNQVQRIYCESVVERATEAEGLELLGWRDVPTDNSVSPAPVIETEPRHRQVFVGRGKGIEDEATFERKLYILRKVISNTINGETGGRDIGFGTVSLSCRTLVYKGMFLAYQLGAYYPDLHHPRFTSALALVHQRFSTNTFPSWKLAHPYRMVAHNGEINTLRGNLNWMAARQASVSSPLFGKDIGKLWPISYEGQSDTACFDNALEFLVQGGYSLTHAAMMLIPEAWAGNPLMDAKRRAFYEYHACLMEPWDGPAAMAFTDGRQIGATLDRNGLRPARYFVTDDDLVVMASETGVLPVPEEHIVQKWRLQPGKMLLIDLEKGRIVSDDEIKAELASAHPYQQWLDRTQIRVHELPGTRRNCTAHQCEPARPATGLRLHAGKRQVPDGTDGRSGAGSGRLHGHRHAALGPVQPAEAAAHLFQAELRASDQSRRSTRSARSWSCRWSPSSGHGRTCSTSKAPPSRSGSKPRIRSSPTRTWSASARSVTSPTTSSVPSPSTSPTAPTMAPPG